MNIFLLLKDLNFSLLSETIRDLTSKNSVSLASLDKCRLSSSVYGNCFRVYHKMLLISCVRMYKCLNVSKTDI